MSQVKVEQNKELKKNRKKEVQKNKMKERVANSLWAVCMVVIAGWIAFSVYNKYEAKQIEERRTVTTEVDLAPLQDYISALGE